jgi:cell division septal protein FtsQ
MRGRRRRIIAGRGPLSRTERAAQERRERALAHLERLRGRTDAPRDPRLGAAGAVATLLAASIAAGALFGPSIVTGATRGLEAIHVRGLERLSGDEIATATGVARGAPPPEVDPEAVVESLEAHPWVESARAVHLSTATLLVEVRERVPLAVVAAGKDATLFFVDAGGTPVAPVEASASEGVPRLFPAAAVDPNEPSDALATAVALAQRLPAFGLAVPAQVRIPAQEDAEGFVLRLVGFPARVVLGREDLDERLTGLARLLAANLSEVAEAASVDLRFADQAVLRKTPAPKGRAQVAAERGRATPSNSRPSG